MSGPITCPWCGWANPPGGSFCSKCATRLNVGPQSSAVPQPQWSVPAAQLSRPPPGYSSAAEIERNIARRSDIDKTKAGLLLAIVGVILGAVPFAPGIGLILVIIGTILILLGARPFGGSHSSYVKGSLALVILGIIIAFAVALTASSLDQLSSGGTGQALQLQSVTSTFDGILVGLIIGGVVGGVAYVLLTYDLQERSGRFELYVAYVSQIIVWILIAVVFSGLVAAASSGPAGGFDISQIRSLQSQLQYLQLAGLIPAGLFADAYYRVYSRINDGYLPERARPLSSTSPRYMRI